MFMTSEKMVNTNWDYLFRKELKVTFTKTKKLISEKKEDLKLIEELSSIAENFYETFKDSPIPVYRTNPELYTKDEYISTSIDLPFSCFMIPFFFMIF